MAYLIDLPAKWVDGEALDVALARDIGPHLTMESSIIVSIPAGTSVMVDAGVRLLSLSNQLQHVGKRVTLDFSNEDTSTFDYLNRIGFFDELDKKIIVKPDRPRQSTAARFHGGNSGLVEIHRLVPGKIDGNIPGLLRKAVASAMKNGQRQNDVGNAAFALFGELLSNVEAHSKSQLAGYAVLQVYKNGNGVRIAVSDSGQGLLECLQESVIQHYPQLKNWNPRDLMMHALLNGGISSRGKGRGGAGLKVCADRAQALRANLEIRTPNHCLRVRGKHRAWKPNNAHTAENLPLIWGTHIVFDIRLD
jgi:hypothetical protein